MAEAQATQVRRNLLGTTTDRHAQIARLGLLHPDPKEVTAPLFDGRSPFFVAFDKVQVKYEMLRGAALGEAGAGVAAAAHGYSRAAFYVTADAFSSGGLPGLLDERRGRRGPLKLTDEIRGWVGTQPGRSGAELAAEVERLFGVSLHRRTLERIRQGRLQA